MTTVKEIWRYQVKSLLGESVMECMVNARGLEGDREYAITWPDQKIASGKTTRRFRRLSGLFDLSATLSSEQIRINFPSGEAELGPSDALDARLQTTFAQPVRLARECAISHFDAAPIHIITTEDLAWLEQQTDAGSADARRFRPNLVIDSSRTDVFNASKAKRCIAIGSSVVLEIREPTERCIMTTQEQGDLKKDLTVLDIIATEGNTFGVYADVKAFGTIASGDQISLLD